MEKNFNIYHSGTRSRNISMENHDHELYGYILTEGGEFVLASSAYYQIRTAEKIAELVSLTAFSGMENNKIQRSLGDGSEELYDYSKKVL